MVDIPEQRHGQERRERLLDLESLPQLVDAAYVEGWELASVVRQAVGVTVLLVR